MEGQAPDSIRKLAAQRAKARAEGDFLRADALRDEIRDLGFNLVDTEKGFELEQVPRFETVDREAILDRLHEPATAGVSLLLLYEGYIEDLYRFLSGLVHHHDLSQVQTIVVDPATPDGEEVSQLVEAVPGAISIHLKTNQGWAASLNSGLRAAEGDVVVLANLSVEPLGDVFTPLLEALADEDVAVAGPIGAVTGDLRDWQEAATSEADAIEGYLMAMRRDLLRDSGMLNEKFAWYRNADLDLSLQLRNHETGAARVVEVPMARHDHRGYLQFPDAAERDRQSRRNYGYLLDRWRNARHLLTGAPGRG